MVKNRVEKPDSKKDIRADTIYQEFVGYNDPLVYSGIANDQRIKVTMGITA